MHAPLFSAVAIGKRYAGVAALDRVDFEVRAGEVHALMGQNGAGKSTLIKIITGVTPPDAGMMQLDGRAWRPASPADAQRRGISTVFQEINLVPTLSVAENVLLGRLPRGVLGIRWGVVRRRAAAVLAALDLRIDVAEPLAAFPIAIQQMVAIARAIDGSARLLILDEPTSSLDRAETETLFRTIARLRQQGLGLVFITHFIDQVYRIADRVTILRNGRRVGVYDTAALSRGALVAHMLGRSPSAAATTRGPRAASARPLMEARGIGRGGALAPLDIDIHGGEVVGLAGLLGSGRTELVRLLAGADRAAGGAFRVRCIGSEDRYVTLRRLTPRRALALGIALTPEDRRTEGLFESMSVRENIILAVQRTLSPLGCVSRRRQSRIAAELVQRLNIKLADLEQPVRTLSGGNQQKVVLARWLACDPRLLLLDEPTRGIDIGAKAEIEALIGALAESGMAVVFVSAELDEVARVSDRAIVLRDRRQVGQAAGSELTAERLMRIIAGDGAES